MDGLSGENLADFSLLKLALSREEILLFQPFMLRVGSRERYAYNAGGDCCMRPAFCALFLKISCRRITISSPRVFT